jgi:hypothetical protein
MIGRVCEGLGGIGGSGEMFENPLFFVWDFYFMIEVLRFVGI